MQRITEDKFVDHINRNIGIIHKICNIYFNGLNDRQDACQEILYQLWKSYPGFKGDAKFSTWMYKVALNTAITYAKKGNRELGKEMLPEHFNQLTENNEQYPVNEKMTFLYAAINTLSVMDKAIILLYLEDNSYDEIAAITGLTKSNVSVRLVRIKKRKKNVTEYFWVSLVFQILIYSFACYLLIKFWGDTQIIVLCAAGALLYIPLTIILMRKFKAMYQPIAGNTGDIHANVSNQYKLLTQFFSFKKRFDLVAIPVNCFVLAGILFKLYVPGGIEAHLSGGIIAYLTMLLIFSIAAWFENKKHFVRPLRRFEFILKDIEKNI